MTLDPNGRRIQLKIAQTRHEVDVLLVIARYEPAKDGLLRAIRDLDQAEKWVHENPLRPNSDILVDAMIAMAESRLTSARIALDELGQH